MLNLDESVEYVDLTVTFSKLEGGELLKNTPPVRLLFENEPVVPEPIIAEVPPAIAASASAAPQYEADVDDDAYS